MTTAREVPNTTGMVEAGKDQGRAAMIHLFRVGGTVGSGMILSSPGSPYYTGSRADEKSPGPLGPIGDYGIMTGPEEQK
jgi:hypothetical protein